MNSRSIGEITAEELKLVKKPILAIIFVAGGLISAHQTLNEETQDLIKDVAFAKAAKTVCDTITNRSTDLPISEAISELSSALYWSEPSMKIEEEKNIPYKICEESLVSLLASFCNESGITWATEGLRKAKPEFINSLFCKALEKYGCVK